MVWVVYALGGIINISKLVVMDPLLLFMAMKVHPKNHINSRLMGYHVVRTS